MPSALALARSTWASSCGTPARNPVKVAASSGRWRAASMILRAVSSSSWSEPPATLCSSNWNPPPELMPRIGGGGNTTMEASWMLLRRARRRPRIAPAWSSADFRFDQGVSRGKREATFGPLTPVMKLRPPMATTVSTPGVSSRIFSISRTTASVRSTEAASGSWTLTRR